MKDILINDDCRKYLSEISKDVFFISDPPYNQGYHYDEYSDALKTNEYEDMLLSVFRGRKSVIIHYPEESMMIFGGGKMGNVEQVVSWIYNSNTAKQSRLLTWWNCKPDFRKIGQSYKNPTDKRIAKRISEGKTARAYDWWEINQVKNVSKKDNPHPCPIPDELVRRIILSTTKEGDTICDPFMGSGTVCRIAKELKRHYIGFELSKSYFDYANKTV